jgi:hypothetical protein
MRLSQVCSRYIDSPRHTEFNQSDGEPFPTSAGESPSRRNATRWRRQTCRHLQKPLPVIPKHPQACRIPSQAMKAIEAL